MKTSFSRFVIVLIGAVMISSASAYAGVTVSVTLSGPIEEMLPILQHLKDMGLGAGSAAPEGESIKMEVHSVVPATPETPAPAAPVPVVPPAPQLSLAVPVVEPATVKAGATTLVTVQATDPDHKIDTLPAIIQGFGKDVHGQSFDLYDNATHGDATARDGIWSAQIPVPADLAPGDYTIHVFAYNAHGDPVLTISNDGTAVPLSTQAKIAVTK